MPPIVLAHTHPQTHVVYHCGALVGTKWTHTDTNGTKNRITTSAATGISQQTMAIFGEAGIEAVVVADVETLVEAEDVAVLEAVDAAVVETLEEAVVETLDETVVVTVDTPVEDCVVVAVVDCDDVAVVVRVVKWHPVNVCAPYASMASLISSTASWHPLSDMK